MNNKLKSTLFILCLTVLGILTLSGTAAAQMDGWLCLGGGLLCMAPWIIWLVVWILVAVWVYKDAKSRGMSGALWFIITILLGLIGIIIYLIVRRSHPVQPEGGYPPPPGPGAYPPPPGQGGYPPR